MREKSWHSICFGHRILTVIIVSGLLDILQTAHAASLRCCTHANGSCRSACEQISLVSLATDQRDLELSLQKLNDLCPKSPMLAFWNCMNETLAEIDKGNGWIGRPCCGLPQSEKCKLACLQAQSISDLTVACRKSDEIVFYTCIEKQEAGERCCKNAETENCLEACKNVFTDAFTPSKIVRESFHKHCSEGNSRIQQCIKTYISVTPADNPSKNLHCCEMASNLRCRTVCKEVLKTETYDYDIVDAISRECGIPLPQDRMWGMWQCFLKNSVANEPGGSLVQSERVGMDSAKLQCCFRAATVNCQRLCIDTFSNRWTSSWSDFDRICQYQLAESEMIRCLTEVDEPCELGCEGMKYCSNFNFRPTELFRSCDQRADKAAQHDIELWENGVIHLPMMEIPVLKISRCHSEVWKAIACALQIKPCHPVAHINRICKADCIDILNSCVDRSRLLHNQNPVTLCEILSPPGNDTPCISLSPYLVESKHFQSLMEVSHPCKPNQCSPNDVCMVERNCRIGQPCRPYACVPGCRMGDMSQLIVPRNSYVKVPSNTHTHPRCHMVCYCNHENVLEDCMTQPCLSTDHCFHQGKRYNHNTEFKVDCKTCFCYDGEVTCSPQQCNTGLPCNCQDHYVPVCGSNGKTYPSACLARCVGLTDDQFEFGACYDSDPCSPNSCHPYSRCVPKKRVCLSIRHRSCKQYDCVNMQHNCNQLPKSPVCDTDNVEHPNICWMLQRNKWLAYYGKCMSHCRGTGLVCGHNGETYASECAAWAERVSVDYKGACAAVGSKDGKYYRCGGIRCPPLPSEHCTKVFPPGGCCPICGAALRMLYSQKLSDASVEAIRDVEPVVIQTIAEKIREHVKVTECEVFAYLSLESDIIVLVMAITDSPTQLQVEACVREAEKIQALIQQHSPTLLTELPLSFFTTAIMLDPVTDSAIQLTYNHTYLLVFLLITVIIYHRQRT